MSRHRMAQEHLFPTLETALATLLVGAGGPTSEVNCRPTASRLGRCAVSANAVVAEPRATVEVLEYIRAQVQASDTTGPPMPVLAEITRERLAPLVTVNFLRN